MGGEPIVEMVADEKMGVSVRAEGDQEGSFVANVQGKLAQTTDTILDKADKWLISLGF